MKENKGFTLIEVIAVIALLGILSFIVVVSVNSVRGRMKEAYYEKQTDLIVLAAKDYYSDKRTLLPKENWETEEVSVNTLVHQRYLDPVKGYQNDLCDFDNSKVEVIKIDQGEYRYRVKLECENYQPTGSGSQNDPAPTITITPKDGTKSNRDIPITIKVEDNNLETFRYSIKKDNTVIKTTGYIAYQQENYREAVKENGIYQIEVIAIDKNWNRSTKSVRYRIYKEQADLDFEIVSDVPQYNGLKPTVKIEAKTKAEDVTIVKTEVVAKQGSKVQDTKVEEGLKTNFPWNLGTSLNGLKYDYTVTVTDDYGNKTSKTKSYTVYAECSGSNRKVTGYGNYGSCSGSCGTGTMSRSIYYEDKLTGKKCANGSQSTSCNTGIDCCSKTTTTTSSSGCKGCGDGAKKTTTYTYKSAYTGEVCSQETKQESCKTTACCADPNYRPQIEQSRRCSKTCGTGVYIITYSMKDIRNGQSCGTYSNTSDISCTDNSGCSSGGGGSSGGGSSCTYDCSNLNLVSSGVECGLAPGASQIINGTKSVGIGGGRLVHIIL